MFSHTPSALSGSTSTCRSDDHYYASTRGCAAVNLDRYCSFSASLSHSRDAERSIFCQIRSTEWIKQAWLSSNSEQLAPNIVASVKRFNVVAGWIATQVLTTSSLGDRVRTIEYVIRLAQVRKSHLNTLMPSKEFMTLQNYSGVLQVLSALQGTAVQRLHETWAAVDSTAMQNFHRLSELFQPIYNWRSARELLRRSQPPVIPFIGNALYIVLYRTLIHLQAST